MQTSTYRRIFANASLSSLSAMIGALGFLLSLLVAVIMSLGNPAVLAVWMAAMLGVAAFMRFHRKWRDTFERIYAMHPAQTVLAARKDWRGNVEDVVFREIPNESFSFGS